MIGAKQTDGDLTSVASARWTCAPRANYFLKVLLVCVLALASFPFASTHAKSHLASEGQSQIQSQIMTSDHLSPEKDYSEKGAILLGGLEHHACGSPCLSPLHTRSYYVIASFDGARVRYPDYLDADGAFFKPDPLRKPPRLIASA